MFSLCVFVCACPVGPVLFLEKFVCSPLTFFGGVSKISQLYLCRSLSGYSLLVCLSSDLRLDRVASSLGLPPVCLSLARFLNAVVSWESGIGNAVEDTPMVCEYLHARRGSAIVRQLIFSLSLGSSFLACSF